MFILVIFIFFITTFFNKWFFWTLEDLNNYNNVFFWKITSILNNAKLNIGVIFLLFIVFKNYNSSPSRWNYLSRTALYLFIIVFYSGFNHISTGVSTFFFTRKLNLALLNGVLNIHPWLIFLLYSIMIFFLFFFKNNTHSFKNYWNLIFVIMSYKVFLIFTSTISILLGAFWAFQELSWGGWWNWDIVELISLNLFFLSLIITHSNNNIHFNSKRSIFFLKLAAIALVTIIIVRFNLISSIHAFVNPQTIKLSFFKLSFVFFFYISGLFFFKKVFGTRFRTYSNSYSQPGYFFNSLILLLFIYVLCYATYLIFLNSDKIDLNYIVEFTFILSYFYFYFYFFKNRNRSYLFLSNVFYQNFIFLFIHHQIQQLKIFVFNDPRNIKILFISRIHTLILLFLIFIYFLKIYFASFAVMNELNDYNYIKQDDRFLYTNNFIMNYSTYNLNISFLFTDLDIFFNFDLKAFNLNREVLFQYYRNFLFYFLTYIIKFLSPGDSSIFLFYTNFFLLFIVFFLLFIMFRPLKRLNLI